MCMNPLAMMITQGVFGIVQQQQQARAEQIGAENQARLAEYNAKLSDARASQIADNYGQRQRELKNRLRLIAGQNRNEAGASNLQMLGTPLDMMDASEDEYKQDSMNLLRNQRNDIDTQNIQTHNYMQEASNARTVASNVSKGSRLNMLGTILSSAASIQSYRMNYAKVAPQPQSTGISQYGWTSTLDKTLGSKGAYLRQNINWRRTL